MTVVAISGSLRRESYNTALLRAASAIVPPDVTMEIVTLAGIPIYNADDEAERGLPGAVVAIKDKVAAADGVLMATPEYNFGVPGPLKNAIDWMSRPAKDIPRVFGGRHLGLIGASTSAGGTRMSQAAWLPTLHRLGARVWAGRSVYVANAQHAFDADGRLVDEKINDVLAKYVDGFVKTIRGR